MTRTLKLKLLFVALLLCGFAQGAWAQNFDVWDGVTMTQPGYVINSRWSITYQINTAAEMAWLMNKYNTGISVYIAQDDRWMWCPPRLEDISINANLDMTAANWIPLTGTTDNNSGHYGNTGSLRYDVTLNGNGHTVKIIIDNGTSSDNYQGLFYGIGENAKVKNLHVDCYIKVGNARKVGGICGENLGTIENCWVSGHVESNHYSQYDADLGGIAGLNESGGTIKYCCVTADIKNTAKNSGVGGIAGSNDGTIQHVTFYGSVSVDHSQDNKWVGDQDKTLENNYDSFDSGEYDAASGYDTYRRVLKYMGFTSITINNTDEWNEMAHCVKFGCTLSGKYVKLTNNISVSTMVGDSETNSFQGTFDGDGHTLSFNKSDFTGIYCAPFRYVGNATFRNLRVAGTINTTYQYAGGMIGWIVNGRTVSIENCRSSVTIKSSNHTNGGFVSRLGDNAVLTISGSVFDGSFEGTGHHSGGFVGYCQGGSSATFTDCLFAPDHISCDLTSCQTFSRGVDATINRCYYTQTLGTAQGTKAVALATAPGNLGDLVKDYGMVKAYRNGLFFDGKYYVNADLGLSDNTDNGSAISEYNGATVDVTLTGCTFYKDGAWNTICLPFNLTLAGSPLDGAVARPLTGASISGSTLNLTFGDAVTELKAGTPYIIKWASGENVVNPVFNGVTIDATDRSFDNGAKGDERVRFIGVYKSIAFDGEDKSVLLLGGGNTLYQPISGAGVGALRAYFKIGDSATKATISVKGSVLMVK